MQQQSVQKVVGATKCSITKITLSRLTLILCLKARNAALHAETKYEGLAQSDLSQFYPSL